MDEFTLQFTPNCLNKLEAIAQLEDIDEALEEVYYSLRKNPYAFKVVPPLTHWRVAITKLYLREGLTIPPLSIYFVIKEEEKIVKIVDVMIRRGFGDLDL
jgi:hypothetical protein